MSLFGVRSKLLFCVLVVVRIVDVACERKCGRGPRSRQLESGARTFCRLLEMAVNELESLDIVDVQLTPIVKAKPAPSTNQLGTLSQAQAVAA